MELATQCQERAVFECALGVVASRIPLTPLDVWRSAALTSRSRAGVPTALAASPLAGEVVALHVCAANVACSHAHVATTAAPCSALESFATAVVALQHLLPGAAQAFPQH